MQDKPKPTSPKLLSPDWWTLRRDVEADISASQARLRRDYPLEMDKDPALRAAVEARSKAATELALYGPTESRAELWDQAVEREARVRRA